MLRALLPLVGCGGMMVVCMLMMRGGGRKSGASTEKPTPSAGEVETLRAEVARLRDEVAHRDDPANRG